jgi:Flp pilus assembly protein TadD
MSPQRTLTKLARNEWRAWQEVPGALLLLAATLLAYVPAMRGGYIWDDDAFVTDNLILRGGAGALARIWFQVGATDQYYPLTYSTFWLEYHLCGLWPTGSHIVNVVLHALNAWLAWRVLRRLRLPGAALAAFIFALHPVEVESVAWITERKNVLSATLYLCAMLAYLRFQPPEGADDESSRRDWRFYALAGLLFLFALWSKTVTFSLPAALLVIFWWKKERLAWSDLWPLVPLFIIGAGMGELTGWMEKHVIGARGNDWSLTLPQRLLIAGRAPWFYAGKLAWPTNLTFFYPRWTLDAGAWQQWLFPAASAALVVILWSMRACIGKGPLAGALYFGVTLFPALGFINVYPFRYSFVADHFQYLASLGPIALLAAGLTRGFGLLPLRHPVAAPACSAVLVALIGVLTWQQGRMYADIRTLYAATLERNPGSWMVHDNLSVLDLQAGHVEEALAHSRQSLALKPGGAEGNVNLANALAQKGRLAEARLYYERALEIRPDFAEAHSDLGNIFLYGGRVDDAIAQYRAALQGRPNYAEAHNNLGYALLQAGRVTEAVAQFQAALQERPDYKQARENLDAARARQTGSAPAP